MSSIGTIVGPRIVARSTTRGRTAEPAHAVLSGGTTTGSRTGDPTTTCCNIELIISLGEVHAIHDNNVSRAYRGIERDLRPNISTTVIITGNLSPRAGTGDIKDGVEVRATGANGIGAG